MRVILAGPDLEDLTHRAYPAFAAAGADVVAVAAAPEQLAEFARMDPAAILVVEASLFPEPDRALEALRELPNPKAVILPGWAAHREAFAALPGLVVGFLAPVPWPEVVSELRGAIPLRAPAAPPPPPPVEPLPTSEPPPVPAPLPSPAGLPTRRIRVGFWGARGGVGTSTAALTAARLLAEAGRRVLLCDATGRGDLHVMLGLEPQEGVLQAGPNLFVCLGIPSEIPPDADLVVDGGRARRDLNAERVEVSRPIPLERLRRILGLPPGERKPAGRQIGFIRLEVTE
ncbi:MAG: hypothetical protein QN160_10025 [Armatimonadota bacterium]|nr:hypothetical protein [Armatimonadota bacterium]